MVRTWTQTWLRWWGFLVLEQPRNDCIWVCDDLIVNSFPVGLSDFCLPSKKQRVISMWYSCVPLPRHHRRCRLSANSSQCQCRPKPRRNWISFLWLLDPAHVRHKSVLSVSEPFDKGSSMPSSFKIRSQDVLLKCWIHQIAQAWKTERVAFCQRIAATP